MDRPQVCLQLTYACIENEYSATYQMIKDHLPNEIIKRGRQGIGQRGYSGIAVGRPDLPFHWTAERPSANCERGKCMLRVGELLGTVGRRICFNSFAKLGTTQRFMAARSTWSDFVFASLCCHSVFK